MALQFSDSLSGEHCGPAEECSTGRVVIYPESENDSRPGPTDQWQCFAICNNNNPDDNVAVGHHVSRNLRPCRTSADTQLAQLNSDRPRPIPGNNQNNSDQADIPGNNQINSYQDQPMPISSSLNMLKRGRPCPSIGLGLSEDRKSSIENVTSPPKIPKVELKQCKPTRRSRPNHYSKSEDVCFRPRTRPRTRSASSDTESSSESEDRLDKATNRISSLSPGMECSDFVEEDPQEKPELLEALSRCVNLPDLGTNGVLDSGCSTTEVEEHPLQKLTLKDVLPFTMETGVYSMTENDQENSNPNFDHDSRNQSYSPGQNYDAVNPGQSNVYLIPDEMHSQNAIQNYGSDSGRLNDVNRLDASERGIPISDYNPVDNRENTSINYLHLPRQLETDSSCLPCEVQGLPQVMDVIIERSEDYLDTSKAGDNELHNEQDSPEMVNRDTHTDCRVARCVKVLDTVCVAVPTTITKHDITLPNFQHNMETDDGQLVYFSRDATNTSDRADVEANHQNEEDSAETNQDPGTNQDLIRNESQSNGSFAQSMVKRQAIQEPLTPDTWKVCLTPNKRPLIMSTPKSLPMMSSAHSIQNLNYNGTPHPSLTGRLAMPSAPNQCSAGPIYTASSLPQDSSGQRGRRCKTVPPMPPLRLSGPKQNYQNMIYGTPTTNSRNITLNSSGSEVEGSPPDMQQDICYSTQPVSYNLAANVTIPTPSQLNQALSKITEQISGDSIDLGRMAHNAKERARRSRIKNACDRLRDVIPGITLKTDKASVFELAVDYITFLKQSIGGHCDEEFRRQYSSTYHVLQQDQIL